MKMSFPSKNKKNMKMNNTKKKHNNLIVAG